MYNDPVIEELHEIRAKMWAEIEQEPGGVVAYFEKHYQLNRHLYGDRLISPEEIKKRRSAKAGPDKANQESPIYQIPLLLHRQLEGGYTITSLVVPELVTEGNTLEEALNNVNDALKAVIELYQETNRELPERLILDASKEEICFQYLFAG